MSFSTLDTEIGYDTDGVDTTYAIPFVYSKPDFIKVELYDSITNPEEDPIVVSLIKDEDFRFVDQFTIETIELLLVEEELVPTPLALPAGLNLRIFRDTRDDHPEVYSTYHFPAPEITKDLDKIYQRMQELRREVDRAIKLNYLSLEDGEALTGEDILAAIQELEDLIAHLETGGGLPPGGITGDFIEKISDEDATWVTGQFVGFSARFNENFEGLGLTDTLNKILQFQYTGPGISLSVSPSASIREKGTVVSSVTLTANVTKRSEPITEVTFYRAGVLFHTESSPSPTGGSVGASESTPFSDTMSFYARVSDGVGAPVQSNTVTYSYVYPYYHGTGLPGRTASEVAAMTKSVIGNTNNLSRSFTTGNGDVYYFAFPYSYGAITSVLDANNFQTVGDWTMRDEMITGLDGSPVRYRIYEFNNPVVAGSTSYIFGR